MSFKHLKRGNEVLVRVSNKTHFLRTVDRVGMHNIDIGALSYDRFTGRVIGTKRDICLVEKTPELVQSACLFVAVS